MLLDNMDDEAAGGGMTDTKDDSDEKDGEGSGENM
jgi:hypothetical protein